MRRVLLTAICSLLITLMLITIVLFRIGTTDLWSVIISPQPSNDTESKTPIVTSTSISSDSATPTPIATASPTPSLTSTDTAVPTDTVTPTATPLVINRIDEIAFTKDLGFPDSRKIVRDSAGNLYVAYRNRHDSVLRIFMAKSTDNGATWSILNDDQPIERVGNYKQRVPSIAIDSNDKLHIVWYGVDVEYSGENERQIKYMSSMDGGDTWSEWINVAPISGYNGETQWQEHPVVFVDRNDRVYVVWEGRDAEHNKAQIKFVRSTDGGTTWTEWRNVDQSHDVYFSKPTLVTNTDGTTLYLFAYAQLNGNSQIVWTQSLDGGEQWTLWSSITPDAKDQRHLAVAIDSADRVHVVWRQQPQEAPLEATTQIHYAMYDSGVWNSPQIVSDHADVYQFFPSIAIYNEQVWIVWSEGADDAGYPEENPTDGRVFFVAKSLTDPPDSGWDSPVEFGQSEQALYPSLRRIGNQGHGDLDVVWAEDGDAQLIFHRILAGR